MLSPPTQKDGVPRRDFMKLCSMVAVALGMDASMVGKVAAALESPERPSIVYMHGVECTGCTEALLRSTNPYLDYANRPLPCYQYTVHDKCPRREHFDKGEFAFSFASEEARKGWCLYELGCRGPFTYNNCPTAKFNDASWPVQGGSPCIGCSEPDFWDVLAPFHADVKITRCNYC